MVPVLAALAIGVPPGCGSDDGTRDWRGELWTREPPPYPFVPVRVVVHDLTRAGVNPDGSHFLRIHFQFLDAWNDDAKGLGRVNVQIFATGEYEGEAIEPFAWAEINLSDLDLNGQFYDHVTRTYVLEVPEAAMPEWLPPALAELDAASERPQAAFSSFAGRITIRVVYMQVIGDDDSGTTSSDFVLAP
ncbi:MAG: hypothetical protein AAFX79_04880 [Planctomycetota bacterium]